MHESGKPYHWHADRDPTQSAAVRVGEDHRSGSRRAPCRDRRDAGRAIQLHARRAARPERLRQVQCPRHRRRRRPRSAPLRRSWRRRQPPRHRARLHQCPHRPGQLPPRTPSKKCWPRSASTPPPIRSAPGGTGTKERRTLEEMAYSFINKFPDYADRLPPDLYAMRQIRRGQGVLDPQLVYDRTAQAAGTIPSPPQDTPQAEDAPRTNGNGRPAGQSRDSGSCRSASCARATIPATSSTS